jgi:hypothetical protein
MTLVSELVLIGNYLLAEVKSVCAVKFSYHSGFETQSDLFLILSQPVVYRCFVIGSTKELELPALLLFVFNRSQIHLTTESL